MLLTLATAVIVAALQTVDEAAPLNALDKYVSTPDPNFHWFDTGARVKPAFSSATAHILNVTSQQWLTEAQAIGPNGALWTHQVAVVVPKTLNVRTFAAAVLTGGCNEGPPKPPEAKDEYLMLAAQIAERTGIVMVVVYQLPNCHLIYPSDPQRVARSEDKMIAWAWRQYIDDPAHDPRWLPRFPMVKASFAAMQAVEAYTTKMGIAEIDGWGVSGASKRGWTAWMVGATQCASCPRIKALVPLVPIVPFITQSVHMQYKSLGGLTFAFRDYVDAGIMPSFDSSQFSKALDLVDPGRNRERLAHLPKLAVVSSDDEFMQLDWTSLGWSDLPGETHVLVVPNSEHSLATGTPEVIETAAAVLASVAAGEGAAARPAFEHTRNTTTGAVRVTFKAGSPRPSKVVLRHAQTLSDERRDFRWVRLANETTSPCKLPGFKVPPVEGGGNCAQPMIWLGKTLQADADGSFLATPPSPRAGHYMGYYVELFYPSTLLKRDDYQVSTPGYVWPDTFPFPECKDFATCKFELL